jgi:hypothetical protein
VAEKNSSIVNGGEIGKFKEYPNLSISRNYKPGY